MFSFDAVAGGSFRCLPKYAVFTDHRLLCVNDKAHIVFNTQGFRGAEMTREPLFKIGDFAIWSLILGSVIGYQLWIHESAAPLTTIVAAVEGVAG